MEIKNINCYCIDSELGKKFDYAFYWTDATEEEFQELLNGYLAENNIQEDKKFKAGMFTMYIWQHGYYVHTRQSHVLLPKR
jgi:hypothetical protein